jgi:S1-C subfamily serine protease
MPYLGVSLSDINRPDAVPGLPNTQFPGFPGFPGGRRGGNGNGAGVTPRPTPPAGADHGALVGDVASGSAAEQAGVQASDVIVSFDGFDIYNPDELLQRLVVHKPGDQVSANVLRNGQTVNLTITIGEAPVSS